MFCRHQFLVLVQVFTRNMTVKGKIVFKMEGSSTLRNSYRYGEIVKIGNRAEKEITICVYQLMLHTRQFIEYMFLFLLQYLEDYQSVAQYGHCQLKDVSIT